MPYSSRTLTRLRSTQERHSGQDTDTNAHKDTRSSVYTLANTVVILNKWRRLSALRTLNTRTSSQTEASQNDSMRTPNLDLRTPLLTDIRSSDADSPSDESSLRSDAYFIEPNAICGYDGKPKYMYSNQLKSSRHNVFIQNKKVFIGDIYNEDTINSNLQIAIGATANQAMLHGVDVDATRIETTPPMIIDGLDDVAQMIIPNFPRALQEPALGIVAMGLLVPSVIGAQGMYEEYCEIKEMIENNAETGSIKDRLDDLCCRLIDSIRDTRINDTTSQHAQAAADLLSKHIEDAENYKAIDDSIEDFSVSFEETLKGWQATIRQIGALGGAISMAAVTAEMRLGSLKGFTLFGGLLSGKNNWITASQAVLDTTLALFNSALSSQEVSAKHRIAQSIAHLGFAPSTFLQTDFFIDLVFAPLSQITMTAWATAEIIGGINDHKQLSTAQQALADIPFENPEIKEHLMTAVNALKLATNGNRTFVGVGMAVGQLGMLASTGLKTLIAYEQLKQLGVPLSINSLMVAYESIGEKGIAGVGPTPVVATLGIGVALTLGSVMQKFIMGGVSFMGIDGVIDKIALDNGTESIKKHIKHLLPELLESANSEAADIAQEQMKTTLPRSVFTELQREVVCRAKRHGYLAYALKALANQTNAKTPDRCLTSLEQSEFEQVSARPLIDFANQQARLHLLALFTDPNNDISTIEQDLHADLEQGVRAADELQFDPTLESISTIARASRTIMDAVKTMVLQHQKQLSAQFNADDPQQPTTIPIKMRSEWKDHPAVALADQAAKFLLPEIRFFQGAQSKKSTELNEQDQQPDNWHFVDGTYLSDEATLQILGKHQDLLDNAERIAFQLAHDNNLKQERQATHGLILMAPFIASDHRLS
ncbi:MAG: hypothetical protein P8144_03340 [Gammaproteobacteria bacterium]